MARCNACRRFSRCAISSLCRPVLQVHITMDSSGSVVARHRMPQMGHFGTKSGRLSLRIYWSHPPTGADVLALGKQGRRVRLAAPFRRRARHHRSFRYHHLEQSPISESLSPAVEDFSGHRRHAPAARRTTRHRRGGRHGCGDRHGRRAQPRLCITKSETQTRISASVSEGQFRCLVFISTPT